MNKKIVRKIKPGEESERDNLAYWMSRSADERIAAVEALRREHYGSSARLQRIVHVGKLAQS